MKILHVVTLCSPDMAFGGPLSVALDLTSGLGARGHAVILAAAGSGYGDTLPTEVAGVRALLGAGRQLLPGLGFSGLSSPALLRELPRAVRGADLVHVHLTRDLVAAPAALIAVAAGKPLVLQCHGMVDASARLLARVFDAALLRRLFRRADAVLCLSDKERDDVAAVVREPLDRAHWFPNGVEIVRGPARDREDNLVVFAARLHPRKRPVAFVDAAAEVLVDFPDAKFVLVGPDEGCLPEVRSRIERLGLQLSVSYRGPQSRSSLIELLSRAAVHVQPAVDEPFGMTVLEAMSVGTPVVVTNECGLADVVGGTGAGIVCPPDPTSLADALRVLLADPVRRAEAGRAGRQAVEQTFTMATVVDRLEDIYGETIERRRTRSGREVARRRQGRCR